MYMYIQLYTEVDTKYDIFFFLIFFRCFDIYFFFSAGHPETPMQKEGIQCQSSARLLATDEPRGSREEDTRE